MVPGQVRCRSVSGICSEVKLPDLKWRGGTMGRIAVGRHFVTPVKLTLNVFSPQSGYPFISMLELFRLHLLPINR